MYDLYNKYLLHIKIKKLKAYKLKLKHKWSLWYHEFFNNDWSLSSYKKLYEFDNIADFWNLYNNHIYLNSGMFFLMKDNIKPIYEDINNQNGGYWSIKVNNENIKTIWLNLSLDLIGGSLDKNNIISGLTISYKKNFYIIKIWINNKDFNNLSYINLENIDINKKDILYNNFSN